MTNVPEKLESLVTSLRHVTPTRAELRELLVFLFAGSLEGLEQDFPQPSKWTP